MGGGGVRMWGECIVEADIEVWANVNLVSVGLLITNSVVIMPTTCLIYSVNQSVSQSVSLMSIEPSPASSAAMACSVAASPVLCRPITTALPGQGSVYMEIG